jgi:hypothetical protein
MGVIDIVSVLAEALKLKLEVVSPQVVLFLV